MMAVMEARVASERPPRAAAAGGPADLALAESLYLEGRYTDALVVGQSLLARAAPSDYELACIHQLVAQCLMALGERRLAARHHGLASAGLPVALPQRRREDSAAAASPVATATKAAERCFLFVASRPAYWPAERRRRN
jgi:hypothetical protein